MVAQGEALHLNPFNIYFTFLSFILFLALLVPLLLIRHQKHD